ncbi:MAG TPA: DUF2065 domain-containing protein [Hyphomicrobium sp.]|nr:DUF2065 domain-containing protein [Hyphomicrobium sp.]
MTDLIAGFGIALVLEGLLWALLPDTARRMLFDMANLGERQLRQVAWAIVGAGCLLVWLTRG